MNPFLRTPYQLLTTYSLWLLAACALAYVLWVMGFANAGGAVAYALPTMLALGVICASAYYVSNSFPIAQRSLVRTLLLLSSSSVAAASLWLLLCNSIEGVIHFIDDARLHIALPRYGYITLAVIAIFFYAMSLLIYDALLALNTIHGIERREAAKELWARDAELKALRAQINPHFLFNSLNSISALTTIDAKKAREMTIQLAQFFRESLSLSEMPLISLRKELDICTHFVAIETLRYGDRLKLRYSLDENLLEVKVPPLCLQPLIENAIKHGVSQLMDTSIIHIEIQQQSQRIYIIISNPLAPMNSRIGTPEGTSTGLKNLQARLGLLYGDQALCQWREHEQIFYVELVLPIRLAAEEPQ